MKAIDSNVFRKIESDLYRYYERDNILHKLNSKIISLSDRIIEVEQDIQEVNISIDYYQKGLGISERVQTSTLGTSYVENEICIEIEKLEKERKDLQKRILETKSAIRKFKSFIDDIEANINSLSKEKQKFIRLKYKQNEKISIIASKMNLSLATAYRMREKIVINISEYYNMLFVS